MTARVLVYGYGNPGRGDDGLGPALVRELCGRDIGDRATIESGYQLGIEDAALVAEHDVVVFADADRKGRAPFALRRLEPRCRAEFSTHAVAPETVLSLAREHFGGQAVGFVLGIRGYEFSEFGEVLSPRARHNLTRAVDFMAGALRSGMFAGRDTADQER